MSLTKESMDAVFEQLSNLILEPSKSMPIEDPEINRFIDQQVISLTDTLKNFNVTLNVEQFKRLLINIHVNLSLMKGGTGQLTVRNKSYAASHFKAFSALLTSLLLLYLAYNILNDLTCTLTGESILKYPEMAFEDVFTTIGEMTYLQYVWRSISTLSSNVGGLQANYLVRILQMNVRMVIPDMSNIVLETCTPPATGIMGAMGQFLSGVATPQITSDCVVDTTAELGRQFLAAQSGKLAILAIKTKASFAQVIMLTRFGVGIGAAAIGYFATVLTLPRNRVEAIEDGDRKYLEGGLRQKKRTRKNIKKRKTTKRR